MAPAKRAQRGTSRVALTVYRQARAPGAPGWRPLKVHLSCLLVFTGGKQSLSSITCGTGSLSDAQPRPSALCCLPAVPACVRINNLLLLHPTSQAACLPACLPCSVTLRAAPGALPSRPAQPASPGLQGTWTTAPEPSSALSAPGTPTGAASPAEPTSSARLAPRATGWMPASCASRWVRDWGLPTASGGSSTVKEGHISQALSWAFCYRPLFSL